MGHVRDLPKSKLGVDVERNFEQDYEVSSDKSKIVSELRSAARKADAIYLATDPDREGEAIAWHVWEAIGPKKSQPVYRVTFHEITRNAVQQAVAHPRQIDMRMVDAHRRGACSTGWWGTGCRRCYGIKSSAAYRPGGCSRWRCVWWSSASARSRTSSRRNTGPSRPICRSRPATHVCSAPCWSSEPAKSSASSISPTGEAAEAIKADLDGAGWQVTKITRKDKRRTPAPPFTTSTLQQEASRKLGFGAKQTMSVAQQLYEGVDLGSEGTVGLITYMRTDSVSVSREAQDEARSLVAEMYGREYRARAAQRVPHQSQGRPGSARGDPADQLAPHSQIACARRSIATSSDCTT